MKFTEIEDIFSANRMRKYVNACGGDTRRAMTLYRYNLKLSQEMFTLISCFEVALRNRIDKQMTAHLGGDWLRDLVMPGGAFWGNHNVDTTRKIIEKAYNGLMQSANYSHSKLLAEMEFGVWKYMFSNVQYRLTGRILLGAFPSKPISSQQNQYDNIFIFHELDYINHIRNRIAHHEPICFGRTAIVDTTYALDRYSRMMTLFQWMNIDASRLLYGLDHVGTVCNMIVGI